MLMNVHSHTNENSFSSFSAKTVLFAEFSPSLELCARGSQTSSSHAEFHSKAKNGHKIVKCLGGG